MTSEMEISSAKETKIINRINFQFESDYIHGSCAPNSEKLFARQLLCTLTACTKSDVYGDMIKTGSNNYNLCPRLFGKQCIVAANLWRDGEFRVRV